MVRNAIQSYRAPNGWQAIVRVGMEGTLVVLHTFADSADSMLPPMNGLLQNILAIPSLVYMLTAEDCIKTVLKILMLFPFGSNTRFDRSSLIRRCNLKINQHEGGEP